MIIGSNNDRFQYGGTSSSKSLMKEKVQDEVELDGNSLESTRGFQSDLDLLKRASEEMKKEQPPDSDDFSLIGKIINSGPKNSDDCEYVKKFKEIFDSGKVKAGDIILLGKPLNCLLNIMGKCIPGAYTHTAMYLGKNEKGEHVGIEGWWPKASIEKIESWPEAWNSWSVVSPRHTDGKELSDEERNKAVEFARSAEGCEYNLNLFNNNVDLPIDKKKTEFYCSQLAWASYYHTIGLNIDQNPGFNIKYAWSVAPQELHDSNNVSVIAEDVNNSTLAIKYRLCK